VYIGAAADCQAAGSATAGCLASTALDRSIARFVLQGARRRRRASGYFPRDVFFLGFGLPVAAAFSVAAFFVFFAAIVSLLP